MRLMIEDYSRHSIAKMQRECKPISFLQAKFREMAEGQVEFLSEKINAQN
jgi:hypothetical protein